MQLVLQVFRISLIYRKALQSKPPWCQLRHWLQRSQNAIFNSIDSPSYNSRPSCCWTEKSVRSNLDKSQSWAWDTTNIKSKQNRNWNIEDKREAEHSSLDSWQHKKSRAWAWSGLEHAEARINARRNEKLVSTYDGQPERWNEDPSSIDSPQSTSCAKFKEWCQDEWWNWKVLPTEALRDANSVLI